MHRYPEIANRVSQNLTSCRSSFNQVSLRTWHNNLGNYLETNNLKHIDPMRVFNLDESAFRLCPSGGKVLTRKGDKAVYSFVQNDEKECLTVLFTVNAAGMMLPSFVLLFYQRLSASNAHSFPISSSIGKTDNGWITSESFYEYISNSFNSWLTENNIEQTVVLYVDGHSSHLTLRIAEFCTKNGIKLLALLLNSTHLIQPLDVAHFDP